MTFHNGLLLHDDGRSKVHLMAEVNVYNEKVAAKLDEVAAILRSQSANPFRISAYLQAARMVRNLDRPLNEIVEKQGASGLDELPGIGQTLARLLFQLVKTGRLPMLDRLRGSVDPVDTLASVPGIGRKLAERIHGELGIDTLEELEAAAYDGRLSKLNGIGQKRIAGIRGSLSTRLGRIAKYQETPTYQQQPPVSEILDVDREYREKASSGALHKIAPRRFNPNHEAWLPILHTARNGRHYTALYSNTALAHELGRTDDWVVIYLDTDHSQRQYTVVSSERGMLSGNRVVRGREPECREFYLTQWQTAAQAHSAVTAAAG